MYTEEKNGCMALTDKVSYKNRKKSREDFQKAGKAWWENPKINWVTIPIFSAADGMVLYSIFDASITENAPMVFIMSLTIALILNLLAPIIAKFVRAWIYQTRKHAGAIASILITGFFILYAGTVLLRFAYSDMYGQEKQTVALQNETVNESIATTDDDSPKSTKKGNLTVLLLSLSPLMTSLVCFAIAFICEDELEKKIEQLELHGIELDAQISDTKAAIKQLENRVGEDINQDFQLDEEAEAKAIEEVMTRCDVLRAQARFYLAEYLADPSSTTKISQEMLMEQEESEDGSDGCVLSEIIECA